MSKYNNKDPVCYMCRVWNLQRHIALVGLSSCRSLWDPRATQQEQQNKEYNELDKENEIDNIEIVIPGYYA